MASIRCAHCKATHGSVEEVRQCSGVHVVATTLAQPATPDPFAALARQGYYDNDPELKAAALAGDTFYQDAAERGTISPEQAARYERNAQPATQSAARPQRVTQSELPKGRYALEQNGAVRFYLVTHGSPKGKWAGWVFVSGLVGSPGAWREMKLNRSERDQAARKLAESPEDAARLFGRKAGVCGHCLSPLSKATSRAAGYGADCATNHGYWYPSEAEALRILGEMAQ
jgi:hypothetical protein